MNTHRVLIVVPTWNEEGNISLLAERIAMVMTQARYTYEIIFVDDNSSNHTRAVITQVSRKYPVSLLIKQGAKGKAQSLLEGFATAKYDIICMIDADLQYPPEAIPEMVKKIESGADVIVANRQSLHTGWERRILSRGFFLIFGKLLHGFHCDVESGLKVFKKEVYDRIYIQPSPWTFDLGFLRQARDAGYAIDTVDIVFHERQSGKAKIGLVKASYEIGLAALKLRFANPRVIPFHSRDRETKGDGFHYKGSPFVPHNELDHSQTALYTVAPLQKLIAGGLLVIL